MPRHSLLHQQAFGIENQEGRLGAFGALWQGAHFLKLLIFRSDFEKRIRSLPIYPKVPWLEPQISLPLLLYISGN